MHDQHPELVSEPVPRRVFEASPRLLANIQRLHALYRELDDIISAIPRAPHDRQR
ncbi:MAG: hypothetical protein JXR83_03675 [Deltaproteobacteria bacterium]|nr:hypothetical protein [Deltaproteobacteria bacterium]